jgi:transposase-like protein
VPEFEKRWRRFARPVGTSWRVDETFIPVRGRWHYLYRAVDKHGKTIDFLLRPDRGIAAALAFFRKVLGTVVPRVPRKITLDGHVPSGRALWLLRREHLAGATCWFEPTATSVTIAGIELAHRIRKRQFMLSRTYRRLGKWSVTHRH